MLRCWPGAVFARRIVTGFLFLLRPLLSVWAPSEMILRIAARGSVNSCPLRGLRPICPLMERMCRIICSRRQPSFPSCRCSIARWLRVAFREWLSYSAERAHTRSLALVVGIASRNDEREDAGKLFSMLRPLGPAPWPAGHFHAAAFSYRPLKKGTLDLRTMVATLFESENLESVMHLLNDTREISGPGESEFVRGACWFGPISEITERV